MSDLLESNTLSKGGMNYFVSYSSSHLASPDTLLCFIATLHEIVGSRSIQLDRLVTDMTEYYDSEDNRELHKPEKIKQGDIVAAKFPHDDSWYRGQVCDNKYNSTDPSQSLATVYYVDFGDTEKHALV
ncbi:hypothetical protein SK128_007678 [Halocaridina rubra]|uniref:Tudor domain-containing protein n=1 Tax=Halocaridina rubra TaxID=373956 RepID=A0AAN8WRK0_HALRR